MWFLTFYRFYISLTAGILFLLFLHRDWWVLPVVTVAVRLCWLIIETRIQGIIVNRMFKHHSAAFKQEMGPYGIRLINRAERDPSVKMNLAEVFTENEKKLRKAVEQLETMDTLFRAGLRPDGDSWQLHDLKLKYGRLRIEKLEKDSAS
jgi:hypothetical protein